MFTQLRSTVRVLCMLMHLRAGHVTLLYGGFQPPKFSPNLTYGAGQIHVGLCPKFLVILYYRSICLVYACERLNECRACSVT